MKNKAGIKFRTLFWMVSIVVYLAFMASTLVMVNRFMMRRALSEAKAKAEIILDRNMAVHSYFTRDLKPAIFKFSDACMPEEYFDPHWMSSTYAIRKINDYSKELQDEDFYYKEASINARSPKNEADAFEKKFIEDLNKNPKLIRKSGAQVIGGKPFFFTLRRGEEMQPACLRCHGDPAKAPADLVRFYGDKRSFHRKPSGAVQAISIRIPLETAYAQARGFTTVFAPALFVAFTLFFGAILVMVDTMILGPMEKVRSFAELIVTDPSRLGKQIPVPRIRELRDLTNSFNATSTHLKNTMDHLEARVKERTRELSDANASLEQEIQLKKQNEEKLLLSEDRYRSLFEASMDAVLLTIPDGRILAANQSACKMFGRTEDELIQSGRAGVIDMSDPKLAIALEERSRSGRVNTELTFLRSDSSKFSGELSSALFSDGAGNVYTSMVIRDITERKQHEAELQREKEFAQNLLDTAQTIVLLLDPQGNIVYINKYMEELSEYKLAEVQGKDWFSMFLPECDRSRIKELFLKASNDIQTAGNINSIIIRDGRERDIEWYNKLLKDENGNVQGLLSIGHDITERIQTETALRDRETLLRIAGRVARLGGWYVDLANNRCTWSDEVAAIHEMPHGYSPLVEDGIGFYAPEWREKITDIFTACAREGTPYDEEMEIITASGHRVWVRTTGEAVRDESGKITGVQGAFQDITERRRIQDEMSLAAREWQTTFDAMEDAIWILGPDQRVVRSNKTAETFFNRPCEDMIGKRCWEIVHGTTQPISDCPILRARENLRREALEIRMGESWFEIKVDPIIDAAGAYSGAVHVVSDITARKKAEETVCLSEERLQILLKISQYDTTDSQAFFDYALEEAIKLTRSKIGYIYHYNHETREFILNTWSKEVMKECSINEPQTVYQLEKTGLWGEAVRQRKPIMINDFQAQHPLKKGYPHGHAELSRFLTVPIFRENRIVAVAGVANKETDYDQPDVLQLSLLMDGVWKAMDHRRAEQALRENVSLLEKVFNVLPIGLWFADKHGRLIRGNPAGVRIWGYEPHVGMEEYGVFSARRLPSGEAIAPDDWALAHSIREGVTVLDELLEIDAFDGNKKIILNSTAPVLDDSGNIMGAVVINQDITKQKLAEQNLRSAEEQFRHSQKIEAVGRLAGGIAHDFNNMLVVINGFSEMAINSLKPGDPLRRDLEEILSAGRRSADLTRQLLAFSRKQVLNPEILDLNEIVTGVEPMIRRLIGEDIDLIVSRGQSLGAVRADPGQIEQVLVNLAVNARDAMPAGGKLTLETANAVLDEDYAARHPETTPGQYVMLSVTDTGCGMDPSLLDRIFEPFFTTKESGKGTGLGLSTVYGIIKQSGGNIWVYSEPGTGTAFKIYLPRELSDTDAGPRKAKPGDLASGTETILVVEDEPFVCSLTQRILEAAGYSVLTTANGGEALLMCEREGDSIHLMITDIVMPGMSGRELAERLAPLCPRMKVLYMSGYTEDAIVHHGVLDHGIHFISKPFSVSAFTQKVRDVLDE